MQLTKFWIKWNSIDEKKFMIVTTPIGAINMRRCYDNEFYRILLAKQITLLGQESDYQALNRIYQAPVNDDMGST